MSKNLEHLVPKKIWDLLALDRFDLEIQAKCHEFDSKWPKIQIVVDNEIVYDGEAVDDFTFRFSKSFPVDQQSCKLDIIYHSKLDTDTRVVDGEIVANQGLDIKSITINNIDIVESKLMFELGMFTMNLSPAKKLMFKKFNINTEPSTTLGLYENGTWEMTMKLPVVSYFSELHSRVEVVEAGPWEKLIEEIYRRAEICAQLEKNQESTSLPR